MNSSMPGRNHKKYAPMKRAIPALIFFLMLIGNTYANENEDGATFPSPSRKIEETLCNEFKARVPLHGRFITATDVYGTFCKNTSGELVLQRGEKNENKNDQDQDMECLEFRFPYENGDEYNTKQRENIWGIACKSPNDGKWHIR